VGVILFFFQAEDGIRDPLVTGVQTCALPISDPPLVVYDSPTAGLDPITANTIMELIAKERDVQNTANLIVTQRYQDGQLMANFQIGRASCRERVEMSAGSG